MTKYTPINTNTKKTPFWSNLAIELLPMLGVTHADGSSLTPSNIRFHLQREARKITASLSNETKILPFLNCLSETTKQACQLAIENTINQVIQGALTQQSTNTGKGITIASASILGLILIGAALIICNALGPVSAVGVALTVIFMLITSAASIAGTAKGYLMASSFKKWLNQLANNPQEIIADSILASAQEGIIEAMDSAVETETKKIGEKPIINRVASVLIHGRKAIPQLKDAQKEAVKWINTGLTAQRINGYLNKKNQNKPNKKNKTHASDLNTILHVTQTFKRTSTRLAAYISHSPNLE